MDTFNVHGSGLGHVHEQQLGCNSFHSLIIIYGNAVASKDDTWCRIWISLESTHSGPR